MQAAAGASEIFLAVDSKEKRMPGAPASTIPDLRPVSWISAPSQVRDRAIEFKADPKLSRRLAMITLDWKPVPQDFGGPMFPVLFQSAAGTGTLSLANHDRATGNGTGLASLPAPITGTVAWTRLASSHGGPRFPELLAAAVPGGSLVVGVLNTASGAAVGLSFVPSAPIGRLDFQQVSQNLGGPSIPELFSAPVGQGVLLVGVDNRARGSGTALAFVPARVSSLEWRPLEQSHGGPRFPVAFAAPVSGGTLVLADLDTAEGSAVGITFVPGSVPPRLEWVQVQQAQGGPRFPLHFRAPAGSGGLVLSLIDTAKGVGVDLTFLAGG